MLLRFRIASAILPVVCLLSMLNAGAQTPIALPYTMTTLNSSTSASAYGGVVVDSFGNVFALDNVSNVLRMISPFGTVTTIAGGGTSCAAVDSAGDGCIAATQTVLNGPRGIGIDPYGNILIAGYNDSLVHLICRTASPLCTAGTASPTSANPVQIQIGYMGLVAGCTSGTTKAGVKATGPDNLPGYWSTTATVADFNNSVPTTCSASTAGTVNAPRGATADVYGNIYYGDTQDSRWRVVLGPKNSAYFPGDNPLYAILVKNSAWTSVTPGYAYTIAGYSASTSTGCYDTYGDGCLFTSSYRAGGTSYAQGMGVDAAGNMIFTDPGRGLRVLFVSDGTNFAAGTPEYLAGQAMTRSITLNNLSFSGFITPQTGFTYMLAGGGSTTISATPTLGASTSITDTGTLKMAVSPAGNVYIGDGTKVFFYDIYTGYVRLLLTSGANKTAGNYCNGSSGQTSLGAYSEGCPVSNSAPTSYAAFGNGNGLGLAVDGQGNLYLFDSASAGNTLVRKVMAQGFAPRTLGTPLTQTFQAHFPVASAATATVTHSANGTVSYGAPSCSVLYADSSADCWVTATSASTAVDPRSANMTLTASGGEAFTFGLNGTTSGSVMAVDSASAGGTAIPPTASTLQPGTTPIAVAVDGAGNVYTVDGTNGYIYVSVQGGAPVQIGALASGFNNAFSQMAVDAQGNVFVANSGIPTITELKVTAAGSPSTYAQTSIAYAPASGTAAPYAVAVDNAGNLFVADYQSAGSSIFKLSLVPNTLQYQTTVYSGYIKVNSLAVDAAGKVIVADYGASTIYKLTPNATGNYVSSTVNTATYPWSLAVDAAGDIYVQDANSKSLLELPVSGASPVTIYAPSSALSCIAVDGVGNVYGSDPLDGRLIEIVRSNAAYDFGTSETTTYSATLSNVGNLATTASSSMGNVDLEGGSGTACTVNAGVLGALGAGQACTISATMMGAYSTTSSGPLDTAANTLSFIPAASTLGSLAFNGTLPLGSVQATTTTITGPAEATPTYSATGTEATFTVTVAATVPPTNNVSVTVDSSTTNYPLNSSGVATVALTGLSAGPHSISAKYVLNGLYQGSSSTTTNFTIAQASTTVSGWTPGTMTRQVSRAIGAGVLNATASTVDTSVTSAAGNFVYTAACTSTDTNCLLQYPSAVVIDASTYLPIGTYTLGATFVPTDTGNYSTNATPTTVTGFTVTQASTTAAVGATNRLVAADGTGNYTSLSAALAALPVTGGSIYLKPGTYSGQNAISYPNVYLRGLGGDPTAVIVTGENGRFDLGTAPTGFGYGPANKGGNEGSATLDVSKNGYMGTTAATSGYAPYGFYADYLTIQNTYNTSTATNTNFSTGSGSCALGGTSQTLQYWYNAGLECGSQALALNITADQAILNNVNLASQQDTLFAASQSGSTSCTGACLAARQYFWKGMITGDVDYIFGDSALVLDRTNIFTTWHGTATGTETIEAQNKAVPAGSSNDYLSGYICNACTLMSQGSGMSKLYYGRPYGTYSTWVMLNSLVDQVNAAGWVGWDGGSLNLSTSTYAEYNTQPYTDPAVGVSPYPAILAGGVTPTGGNSGAGATSFGSRESYALHLTAAQAAKYFPLNFLSTSVSTTGGYNGMPATWNPITALANAVNAFASTGASMSVAQGTSVTILGRPQTPGAGFIPTGTYQFLDGGVALASGSLDASGEASLTTSTLSAGTHLITMVYSGDSNFAGSTSTTPFVLNVTNGTTQAPSVVIAPAGNATYGSATSVTVSVVPGSGTTVPSGTLLFTVDSGTAQSVTLSGTGSYTFTLSSLTAGTHTFSAIYEGDSNFLGGTASGYTTVARAPLQVVANNATMIVGGALPSFTYTITGYVNSETSAVLSGAPVLATAATGSSVGEYPIAITTGTLSAGNYTFTFTNGVLYVTGTAQAVSVATGDTRTVTEPVFPAVCQQLTAGIAMVNDDIPDAIDNPNTTPGASTNPDGARIQAALNACSTTAVAAGTNLAVQLSIDGAGHNAFLTGPLSMPSNVTLLVDPAVVVFFSRNAQDYDKVPGTHTCGNITNASATSSCTPLIDIPAASKNVGIMGYGKLDGRGGDKLINAVAPYQGYSWWGLSAAYASPNSQQNPRWIQMESGSSNITLYKITLRNAPLFHVATGGAVTGFTAWDIKIVTPTSSRNTDGIDPGNLINGTITRSWISDGDDNVAVGGAGTTAPAANISVTGNHFFAGHGESIGSYTGAGISNILWDGNMSAGNGVANLGSASITGTADSNSTGIRIKSENDRGGLVTGIQYSNSCFLDHKADIQFTPLYGTNAGTLTPNFNNILLQNLVFLNDNPTASAGTLQFTGAVNGSTINPLIVTLDNVSFPSALSSSNFVTTGTAGTETYALLTYGPGQVSSNFVSAWAGFAGSNGDTVTDNRTAPTLNPPACSFTYIAPELTGPSGMPQTIAYGQNATAVVILTPAVGGAAYPTGAVTLTDALTSSTYTATLTGTSDTIAIPLTGLSVGTHTFTAAYSGDTNYPLASGQTAYSTAGPYVITVNPGSLSGTSTALALSSASTTYGTVVTATATVTGSSPTGAVQFVVSGGGSAGSYAYATVAVTPSATTGTASASITLPYDTTAYSITAIYSGDAVNAGSTSSALPLTVGPAITTTSLTASTTSAVQGQPVLLTATIASVAGIATAGTVSFTYSITSGGAQIAMGTAAVSSGATTYFTNSLPLGTSYVTATYSGSGSFAGSTSTPMQITVTAPAIVQLPIAPIPLPYLMTTIAGGGTAVTSSTMACAGATNKYGDGCQASAIAFTASDDMRAVAADPFGNVYLSDISASRVRRIAPNGIITTFAGGGSTCTPPASTSAAGTGCVPTQASLTKPRGVSTDAAGDVLIADYTGNKVYEVKAADGLMYLVAGTGTANSTGDGSLATAATVNTPRGAWADALGNVYIAETGGNRIRVVDAAGYIHAFAGTGISSSTGDGGVATAATVSNPQGVMTDANLNVYIADGGGRIRVVCVTCGTGSPLDALLARVGVASPVNGDIYTVAGNGSSGAGYSYNAPVLSTTVPIAPQKLALDNSGNIYISDSNGFIWFLDFQTGYLHAIATNAATVCGAATNAVGDGCPANRSKFGASSAGLGVGTDTLGNVYISDSTNGRIRKVITGLASPSTATGSTVDQPVQIHYAPGSGPDNTTPMAYASTEWVLSTPGCIMNADDTSECLFMSSFTPAVPGARSTPLAVNSTESGSANFALTGTGLGAGATLDPASQLGFGANLQVAGLATDNAGNVYVSDATSKKLLRFAPSAFAQGASATSTSLATLTAPGAVVVDPRGYVYVADTSAGTITQISPAGNAKVVASGFAAPAGLAVDAQNNIYLSDSSAKAVYQYNALTGVSRTLPLGTLVTPKGLAIDPAGNLLIADPGAPALYRYSFSTGTRSTVTTSSAAPIAVVTDAAGNLLIADSASILAAPASSNSSSFTVASLAPSALAIDSAGNLYTGSGGAVLELVRTHGSIQYSASTAAQNVSLLESGNQALALSSVSQTDSSDYSLTATASTDCTVSAAQPTALAVGGVCVLTAAYTPTTFVATTDTATFNGNLVNAALSTPAAVQLVLTGPATPPATTIVVSSLLPASPVWGQTVTASATVSGPTLTPAGTALFTLDSSTATATVNVVNGVATTLLTGLSVGPHEIYATYSSTNGFAPSTSATANFTVGKATPLVSVTSSVNPVLLQNSTTLTATVSSTVSMPTGTVTFLDGATPLGTSPLSGGVASLAVSSLAAGSHSITASYNGDGNFLTATSSVLTQLVQDFSFTISSTSVTVLPGGTAVFTFSVAPLNATTFPAAVTFTLTGLPAGATYSFSPASLAAGAGATTVTLTVNIPKTQASAGSALRPGEQLAGNRGGRDLAGRLAPFMLAFVILPFACKLRRAGKRFSRTLSVLLILGAGMAVAAGIGGCGATTGFFGQQQKSYTVVVTGTSGALSHSATVTLTVE